MNYSRIKTYWNDQYTLSAARLFPQFVDALARGGEEAREFVEENAGLVETVAGGPEEVEEILTAIARDRQAVENQHYFFNTAMGLLSRVRTVVQNKFDNCMRYGQLAGLPVSEVTADTLLPYFRKYEEAEGAEGSEEQTNGPAQVGTGTGDGLDAGDKARLDADAAALGAGAPKGAATGDTDGLDQTAGKEAEQAAPESDGTKTAPAPEGGGTFAADFLREEIAELAKTGLGKNKTWEAVSDRAKTFGVTRAQVWAWYDELTAPQVI